MSVEQRSPQWCLEVGIMYFDDKLGDSDHLVAFHRPHECA